MTDKDLKRIYEYMGWNFEHYLVERSYNATEYTHSLDSNSAWECVQEMEICNDWEMFYYNTHNLCDEATRLNHAQFQQWIMNPTNFFNCMAKWLEDRCEVNPVLSRVCEKGTKCCGKYHEEVKHERNVK